MRNLIPVSGLCLLFWWTAIPVFAGDGTPPPAPTPQLQPLTLTEALARALDANDPALARHLSRALAEEHAAVAAAALPDPELTAQVSNVPIDDFSLRDEPMTQALRLGVRQRLPAGRTLALRGERAELAAAGARASGALAERDIARAVRQDWYHLVGALGAAETLDRAAVELRSQIDALAADFATGRSHAQDIYRVELELALIADRRTEQALLADEARARLKRFIGAAAHGPIATDLPELPDLPTLATMEQRLLAHPAVTAQTAAIDSAAVGIDLAREARKPQIAVEAGYGLRIERADMASVGVTLSLPMFQDGARDHEESAAAAKKSAAELDRDLLLLEFRQTLDTLLAREARLVERQELYRALVRTRAEETAAAAVGTYAASQTDFAELVRARLAALDVELREIALKTRLGQTRAELLWLLGELS